MVTRLVGRWEKVRSRRCKSGQIANTEPRPKITCIISADGGKIGGVVDFLIDTGADHTVLMPDDASRLGITSTSLSQGCPDSTRGVGGVTTPIRYLQDVTLEFQTSDPDKTETVSLDRLGVIFPRRDARRGSGYSGMPSLLGRSFLSMCLIEMSPDKVVLSI